MPFDPLFAEYYNSLIFWIIAAAVIGILMKVGIWLIFVFGFFKELRDLNRVNTDNPWGFLFGMPQQPSETPEQRLNREREQHRARYEMRGLAFGLTGLLLGALLVLAGHGQGDTELRVAGFELTHAGPGVVLMVLGVMIITFTRRSREE